MADQHTNPNIDIDSWVRELSQLIETNSSRLQERFFGMCDQLPADETATTFLRRLDSSAQAIINATIMSGMSFTTPRAMASFKSAARAWDLEFAALAAEFRGAPPSVGFWTKVQCLSTLRVEWPAARDLLREESARRRANPKSGVSSTAIWTVGDVTNVANEVASHQNNSRSHTPASPLPNLDMSNVTIRSSRRRRPAMASSSRAPPPPSLPESPEPAVEELEELECMDDFEFAALNSPDPPSKGDDKPLDDNQGLSTICKEDQEATLSSVEVCRSDKGAASDKCEDIEHGRRVEIGERDDNTNLSFSLLVSTNVPPSPLASAIVHPPPETPPSRSRKRAKLDSNTTNHATAPVLCGSSLLCLVPGGQQGNSTNNSSTSTSSWLTGTVINDCLAEAITGQQDKFVAIDSAMSARKSDIPSRLLSPLAGMGCTILLPINIASSSHWVLVVVDCPAKLIILYDSTMQPATIKTIGDMMDNFFLHFLPTAAIKDFTFVARHSGQQAGSDTENCGVATLACALHVVSGVPVPASVDWVLWRRLIAVFLASTLQAHLGDWDVVAKIRTVHDACTSLGDYPMPTLPPADDNHNDDSTSWPSPLPVGHPATLAEAIQAHRSSPAFRQVSARAKTLASALRAARVEIAIRRRDLASHAEVGMQVWRKIGSAATDALVRCERRRDRSVSAVEYWMRCLGEIEEGEFTASEVEGAIRREIAEAKATVAREGVLAGRVGRVVKGLERVLGEIRGVKERAGREDEEFDDVLELGFLF